MKTRGKLKDNQRKNNGNHQGKSKKNLKENQRTTKGEQKRNQGKSRKTRRKSRRTKGKTRKTKGWRYTMSEETKAKWPYCRGCRRRFSLGALANHVKHTECGL